jgi:hypothetical protein
MVFFIPWRVVAEESGAAHFGFGGAMLLDLPGPALRLLTDVDRFGATAAGERSEVRGSSTTIAKFRSTDGRVAYFNCVEIEEKVVLSFAPTPFTAVMMAIEMPAAISPYSMAVAPDSSAKNWRNFARMPPNIGYSSKASVKWTPYKSGHSVTQNQPLTSEPGQHRPFYRDRSEI